MNQTVGTEEELEQWTYEIKKDITGDKVLIYGYNGNEKEVTIHSQYINRGRIYDVIYPDDFHDIFAENDHLELIHGLGQIKTADITNMGSLFFGCNRLKELDLSSFNTSRVMNMSCMFYECTSLESLDLTSFDVRQAEYMAFMFQRCINLKEVLVSREKWVIPENCDTKGMFKYCGCSEVTYVD